LGDPPRFAGATDARTDLLRQFVSHGTRSGIFGRRGYVPSDRSGDPAHKVEDNSVIGLPPHR
jgi:hypothetical protein